MKSLLRWEQLKRGFLLAAMICAIAFTAGGQTFRGTILGSVTDASGASIPGATVTVKNTETGLTRTTESQADGSYSVPELPIGRYDVTVDKPNFQTYVAKGVQVSVASE